MNILLITPAVKGSQSGSRYRCSLGQDTTKVKPRANKHEFDGQRADLMVAIHAWRSARSAKSLSKFPTAPLVVLLSGTDIYRYQDEDPATTLATMELADWLVGLHDRVHLDIPERFVKKLILFTNHVGPWPKLVACSSPFSGLRSRTFTGRKNSLRAAYAARLVPRSLSLE